MRPLGIPTFEDKLAQRAIVLLLEPIYEHDFLPCSYGFRPGRSAHDALRDLRSAIMGGGIQWVLDVDLRRYFDTIDHRRLRAFLGRRVTDGVVRIMIDKWLKAAALVSPRAACTAQADGARALCLLRHHREQPSPSLVCAPGRENLVLLVASSLTRRTWRYRMFEGLLQRYPLPKPRIVHRYATASEPVA